MKKTPEDIFRQFGGQMRMNEAINQGISRYMLYSMLDKGIIERISRGLYRLVSLPSLSHQDIVTVSLRCPKAVICLISALSYHDLTTQIPHSVSIAIPKGDRKPIFDHPPVKVHHFSGKAYTSGIEQHHLDNVQVNIYSPEKTLVDCFKFRNKIGMDIVLEALKFYRQRKKIKLNEIISYAQACRVEKVIIPYLETIL